MPKLFRSPCKTCFCFIKINISSIKSNLKQKPGNTTNTNTTNTFTTHDRKPINNNDNTNTTNYTNASYNTTSADMNAGQRRPGTSTVSNQVTNNLDRVEAAMVTYTDRVCLFLETCMEFQISRLAACPSAHWRFNLLGYLRKRKRKWARCLNASQTQTQRKIYV
eukprot:c12661_g1_i1.p1 GENE.c12661_g1_i1~~c12661_g1_i1.p1  ORF type:complete len:164 (+),score=32.55 c12661_g1_i1:2460-2951(+)